MQSFILAGGSGTRLWPMSRQGFPTQFMKINGDKSLLCQSIRRLFGVSSVKDIHVITNESYKFHVSEELKNISVDLENNMILEPVSRNTGPAVALCIKYCIDKLGLKDDDVIFISPSNQIIKPDKKFTESLKKVKSAAEDGHIVTMGIKPDSPETGYGYIKTSTRKKQYRIVEKFSEKPEESVANGYLERGGYYWNSGMLAFTLKTILSEFERFAPEIHKRFDLSYDDFIRRFDSIPDISIDYLIMERSDNIVMVPLDLKWSGARSWDSLFKDLPHDRNNNVKIGNVISVDTKNTLVFGDNRLISTLGVEDLIVVETDDAILISKKGHTQKIKDIVGRLREEDIKEAFEHTTTYRPWGSYKVLGDGEKYKIKKIIVKPGQSLSLQMHFHRSEHWIVVTGTAKVTIGDEMKFVKENESIYVPKSTLHRIENPGKIILEIIEIQSGEYIGEDDIKRYEDIYGRIK